MATEKDTATAELSEEDQIEEMVKAKSGPPMDGKDKEALTKKEEEEEEEEESDKTLDKKSEEKKEEEEEEDEELSDAEIKSKLAELEEKEDDDLTDEEKAFLKEHGEEDEDEDEDETVSADKFIEDEFGEKFGVKGLKDLNDILDTAIHTTKERDKLKAELEEAKKAEPKYASEGQKQVAKWLDKIGYDPSKYSEGLQTNAQIMAMDLDDKDLSPKIVLEAKFIMDHPELTRQEAQKKFEKSVWTKKYTLNRDDFESDEEFAEAKEDLRIDQKSDVAKATKSLKKVQEEFKVKPVEEKGDKAPEVDPVVVKSIEKSTAALDEHLSENDQIIFQPTDDEEDDFPYQFTEDQLSHIRAVCGTFIKDPKSYDEKGKLAFGSDMGALSRRVAYFLYGDDIFDKLYAHSTTVVSGKTLEEVGKTKPSRKSRGSAGASDVDLSEEKQIEIMLKKKKG